MQTSVTRRAFAIAATMSLTAMAAYSAPANAQQSKPPAVYTGLVKGVAVGGYDPVAYFTEKKPVPGKADITLEHNGATWRFANATNRDAFKASPATYEPQYGGHCAWAVASGYTAKGDPQAWTIASGKLYLNYNKSVQTNWEKDIPGNVRKADGHWPNNVTAK